MRRSLLWYFGPSAKGLGWVFEALIGMVWDEGNH